MLALAHSIVTTKTRLAPVEPRVRRLEEGAQRAHDFACKRGMTVGRATSRSGSVASPLNHLELDYR